MALNASADRQRRALRSVAVQFFVNGAVFASFVPRLPEIRDRVDVSVSVLGVLLSLAGVCGLGASALVGPIIGRLGTRMVMVAGGVALSTSLAVVGLADQAWILLVGLIGLQGFDVMVDVSMNLQGSWLSAQRPFPVMNRLHGLWSLGTLVGGIASARLAAAGVSLPVHLIGAAIILFGVLGYVGPGLLATDERPAPGPRSATEPGRPGRTGGISPHRRPRLALALLAAIGFLAMTMETTAGDWAAFRLADDFSQSAGVAALGFVAVSLGMTVGRLAGDWVSVQLGPRLLPMAVVVAGAGLAVASLSPGRLATLVGFGFAGLGVATLMPALYDAAAKRPGSTGAGLGALTGGLRASGLIMPVMVGALAGTRLGVGGALAVTTLPCALGFLVLSRWLRPQRPRF